MTMFPLQVRRDNDPLEGSEHILALNMHGVHFLDLITHETILHYPFTEVISTRQVISQLYSPLVMVQMTILLIFSWQMETDDGVLFLDMKCGNLMQQRISRIQTDQAVEIARLIKQYITIGESQDKCIVYYCIILEECRLQGVRQLAVNGNISG